MILVEKYLTYISTVRRYSVRTRDIYGKCLGEFCVFTQASDDAELLESLIPNIIRGYEASLLEKKLNARTVNLHISVLSGFCRYLVKEGMLKSNPVKLVKRPKTEKRLPEFFREESFLTGSTFRCDQKLNAASRSPRKNMRACAASVLRRAGAEQCSRAIRKDNQ